MFQHPLSYGINDVCGHIFWLLNCDGTINTDEDPMLVCALSSVTLRKTIDEGEEQESPNPSSTTGKRCLYKPAEPTPSFCYLDFETCGLEVPKFWSWLNMEAPIIDPNTGEICGYEEIVSETAKCKSCGKQQAGCRHKIAYASLHNAWCGKERHPRFPYVMHIYTSGEPQLQENEIEYGAGFTSFRSFSLRLKSNPNFIDPWGIMVDDNGEPSGTAAKYHHKLLKCPPGSSIEELVDLTCACIYCNSDQEPVDPGVLVENRELKTA